MTIDELYSQTNLDDYVHVLPEYLLGLAYKYVKAYNIKVLNIQFKAVKFVRRDNKILYYLQDYSHIPEECIDSMLKHSADNVAYNEGYGEMLRNVRSHNVEDLTQQSAQDIIDRNVAFLRQFKQRAERQKLINLVNNF